MNTKQVYFWIAHSLCNLAISQRKNELVSDLINGSKNREWKVSTDPDH